MVFINASKWSVPQNLLDKSYEEITSMYSASDEMIDKSNSNAVIGRGIEVGHIFNFGTWENKRKCS